MEGEQQVAEEPPPDPRAMDKTTRSSSKASSDSSSSSRSIISTRSLHSEDLTIVNENGRVYPNAHYFMPCDVAEQTRLSIIHRVFLAALGGSLCTAPVKDEPTRVLDAGNGPGDWTLAASRRWPDAEIVGVDLTVWDLEVEGVGGAIDGVEYEGSAEAEQELGANVVWEIDDLELSGPPKKENTLVERARARLAGIRILANYSDSEDEAEGQPHDRKSDEKTTKVQNDTNKPKQPPSIVDEAIQLDESSTTGQEPRPEASGWNFSEAFDFIHVRGMAGAFKDWDAIYSEAYKSLNRSGWIEIADIELVLPGDDVRPPLQKGYPRISRTSSPERPSHDTNASEKTGEGKSAQPSALSILRSATRTASHRSARHTNSTHLDPTRLRAAGFTNTVPTIVDVPLHQPSSPSSPPTERDSIEPVEPLAFGSHITRSNPTVAKLALVTVMEGLESMSLRLLTREMGWRVEDVKEKCEKAHKELLEGRHAGTVLRLRWVVGQRGRF